MRERSVAVIQEALRKVGLTVDVVAMDVPAMMGKWDAGDYDAIYFGLDVRLVRSRPQPGVLEQRRLVSSLESRSAEAGDAVGSAHRRPHAPAVAHAR